MDINLIRLSVFIINRCFVEWVLGIEIDWNVKIEDDCWIGINAVILAGVTAGRDLEVTAGSVVTKDLPPNSVVAGSPSRIINKRKEEE